MFNPPPQRPPWADHPQTTSFPFLVFALPWAKISRRSHPALRYPQPYKQTNKQTKSKLNITPNATLYGEIITAGILSKPDTREHFIHWTAHEQQWKLSAASVSLLKSLHFSFLQFQCVFNWRSIPLWDYVQEIVRLSSCYWLCLRYYALLSWSSADSFV